VSGRLVSQREVAKAGAPGGTGGSAVDEVEQWRSIANSWKRLQRAAEKNLAPLDLSPGAELRIMGVLREQGSMPMNRFCKETLLSQPSITGIIDKLEDRGFVERVRSREDRREVLIAITSKGDHAYQKAKELHRQFVERTLSNLKPGEVDQLVALFKKFADACDPPV
jgi:DNA-binding MarR family transcriptional regulator